MHGQQSIKHVGAWNKLIIKFSASSCLMLRYKYIEMHGQQSIKHVGAWNKLIIKFSASSCLILRNKYIEMRGQQNQNHSTSCGGSLELSISLTVREAFFLSVSNKARWQSIYNVPVILRNWYGLWPNIRENTTQKLNFYFKGNTFFFRLTTD